MSSNIDIGRAFGAPFKDPDWVKKILFGGLFTLLGVTIPAVVGVMLDYIKNVHRGDDTMPDWSDFGDKWVRGLLATIGGLIYALPAILILLIAVIPAVIGAALNGSDGGFSGGMAAALSGSCLFIGLAVLYMIAVSILIYGAYVNFAMQGTFGSMFAFGEIMERIKSNSGYFMAWVFSIVVSFAISAVSSVLTGTGVGAILTPWVSFIGMMMTAHLFGQYAANAYGGTAAPSMAGAPPAYVPPTYAPPAAPEPPTYAPPAPPTAPPTEAPAPPAYSPPAPPVEPPTAPTTENPAPPAPE